MSRLIDADKMLQRLEAWNTSDNMDKALYNFTFMRIKEQPTAYDLDKVIKQLEELRDIATKDYGINGISVVVAICNAIEIVKKGGKE